MKVYCNKRTKVAHKRGTKSDPCYQRALKAGNSETFETFAEAKAEGYRACKRCQPARIGGLHK